MVLLVIYTQTQYKKACKLEFTRFLLRLRLQFTVEYQ